MKKKTNKAYKKIVLAYSGGLDTSIIIPWLKENYPGCEVIAVSGNVGQVGELDGLEEKALKTGASKLYVEDLNKEFIEEVVIPSMQMGAKYENTYLLGTSFARPIIAKRLVEIAKAEGADAICHGCTGKGNDQVRAEDQPGDQLFQGQEHVAPVPRRPGAGGPGQRAEVCRQHGDGRDPRGGSRGGRVRLDHL